MGAVEVEPEGEAGWEGARVELGETTREEPGR